MIRPVYLSVQTTRKNNSKYSDPKMEPDQAQSMKQVNQRLINAVGLIDTFNLFV
jgi:hypothetical protein